MKIFIPTRGRVDNQVTLKSWWLGYQDVCFVVPECEEHLWSIYQRSVVPDDFTIEDIRQHILELPGDRHLVLDDDLKLFRRERPTKRLREATYSDAMELLRQIEARMDDGYVHGAVGFRAFNNRFEDFDLEQENMVALCAHFYRADIVRAEGVSFNPVVPLKEDLHFTLSLLELGYPNVVIQEWVHNQEYSYVPEDGGCGRYRTPDYVSETSRNLRALHPEVVSLRDKVRADGSKVIENRIQWKKAHCLKQENRKWTT